MDINTNTHKDFNFVVANHEEEEEIYPLTTVEIAEAHQVLKVYFKKFKNTKRGCTFSTY